MINDILDFSQISRGKLRLNRIDFDIWRGIKDLTKLIKFQAKQKGLRFEFQTIVNGEILTEKSPSFIIKSDPNRLKQILLNLLGNAVKFTEEGFIRVTLELYRDFGIEPYYLISVEDSGCGIEPEDIKKLFRLFGKLESKQSQKVNQTGVGLGLAISQSLVRLLNGNRIGAEIKVTSIIGSGTTFYFPLYSMDDEPIERYESFGSIRISREKSRIVKDYDVNSINPSLPDIVIKDEDVIPNSVRSAISELKFIEGAAYNEKKKILVVDDDQINIIVISKYLKEMKDITFDVCCNGKVAVDRIAQDAQNKKFYDLILMDCNMPVMDGFEATRNVLKMVAERSIPNVPIIASTANASDLDYHNCFKAGMVDYLSKPFKKTDLKAKISKYLKIA